jgi:hypothetical protein
MAAGGDLGILEGRTLALIHPIVMFGLFGATGYAGYLGWQHRRTRTIGEEISALKKALPVPAEGAAPSSTKEIDALVAVRFPHVKESVGPSLAALRCLYAARVRVCA